MLTRQEYDLLSDDPEIALAEALDIIRQRILDGLADCRSEDSYDFHNTRLWNEAASVVSGFVEYLDVRSIELPMEPEAYESWAAWQAKFERAVFKYQARANLKRVREKALGTSHLLDFSAFELTDDFRDQIRAYTRKIRKILNQVELSERLRELLIKRLNEFEADLDRRRTRWESGFALVRELTRAVGDGAENLDPAMTMAERAVGLMDKAAEQSKLEEAKPKALPKPESFELDDEIPF